MVRFRWSFINNIVYEVGGIHLWNSLSFYLIIFFLYFFYLMTKINYFIQVNRKWYKLWSDCREDIMKKPVASLYPTLPYTTTNMSNSSKLCYCLMAIYHHPSLCKTLIHKVWSQPGCWGEALTSVNITQPISRAVNVMWRIRINITPGDLEIYHLCLWRHSFLSQSTEPLVMWLITVSQMRWHHHNPDWLMALQERT